MDVVYELLTENNENSSTTYYDDHIYCRLELSLYRQTRCTVYLEGQEYGEVKVHELLVLVVCCAGGDMEGQRGAPAIMETLNSS